jgi:intracellular sulfur oxidation DsrE/DsrF family protein
MNRTEVAHYTKQQAEEHLRDALDLVDKVGPPDDLRVVTFGKAVEMLSQKQIVVEQLAAPLMAIPQGARH